MVTSPSSSFNGYNFKVWFIRNKDTLKNILVGVSALAVFFSTTNIPSWLRIILTAIVPGLIKLGVDAIDFYATEVVIEPKI